MGSLLKGLVNSMYDQLVMLISNVGFPIAVSLYLLLRIEKKLEELTKALNSLDKSILQL